MSASEVPPAVTTSPGSNGHRPGEQITALRQATREEYFGGARLVVADARVVYLLLNTARAGVIKRLFGISGENSGLVTLIALGVAAGALKAKMAPALQPPKPPDIADSLIGVSLGRETLYAITGATPGETSAFAGLLLLALAGHAVHPALKSVRGSVTTLRTSAGRAHTDFLHRYGHIIRPTRPSR